MVDSGSDFPIDSSFLCIDVVTALFSSGEKISSNITLLEDYVFDRRISSGARAGNAYLGVQKGCRI